MSAIVRCLICDKSHDNDGSHDCDPGDVAENLADRVLTLENRVDQLEELVDELRRGLSEKAL